MNFKMFAVYDKKAETFYGVQFLNSPAEAIRMFADQINKPSDQPLYMHPDDFELHYLGSFNAATGSFEVLSRPELLASGGNLKVSVPSSSSS